MSRSPLVSVVIPAYQHESYIDDTVRSVLDQKDADFELVVADHSSADRTWERLQRYADDPRVRLTAPCRRRSPAQLERGDAACARPLHQAPPRR